MFFSEEPVSSDNTDVDRCSFDIFLQGDVGIQGIQGVTGDKVLNSFTSSAHQTLLLCLHSELCLIHVPLLL